MSTAELQSLWPGWFQALPVIATFLVMPGILVWVIYTKSSLPRHRRPLYIPGSFLLPVALGGIVPFLIFETALYKVGGRAATYPETVKMFGEYSSYVWTGVAGVLVGLVCLYFVRKGRTRRP